MPVAVATFDPVDTGADPVRLRAEADLLRGIVGRLTGQEDSLVFVLTRLADAFSEVVHPSIRARLGEQIGALQSVVGVLLHAVAVVLAWAQDVAEFRSRRGQLVDHWIAEEAAGFHPERLPEAANCEPELVGALRDLARLRVYEQLTRDFERALLELEALAQLRGRQLRDGPTSAGLDDLRSDGALSGAWLPLVFPELGLIGPEHGVDRCYWGLPPEALAERTGTDAALAAALTMRKPTGTSTDPGEVALALALLVGSGAGSEHTGSSAEDRAAQVAGILADLDPDQRARLAVLFPAAVGNLVGAPFAMRALANRVRVADALHDARAARPGQVEDAVQVAMTFGGGVEQALAEIERIDRRISAYEHLLGAGSGAGTGNDPARAIVAFDPAGDGSWVEVVGTLDADTDAVGVLVPGVGTDLGDAGGLATRAAGFLDAAADRDEQLAMIVWADGDFPDDVFGALSGAPAEHLGGRLAGFGGDLDRELRSSGAAAAELTVLGHSYGGLTVSLAVRDGLVADQVLLVNAAGVGDDAAAAALARTDLYVLVAPGDPTPEYGPYLHGPDPRDLPSARVLDTGVSADRVELTGVDAHSAVFEVGSTAWQNMLAVLIGGEVVPD